ncbi:Aldehyde dehydrogenase 8 member A1 [Entophlyctis luteolus]|nr:Aldehyde dehydrogenase 8 member A1 [Entophlyctis luteolus]
MSMSVSSGASPLRLRNFIDGLAVDPIDARYMPSLNPADSSVFAILPDSSAKDVDLAVNAAARAFPSWSKTSRSSRSAILAKIANLLEERIPEFALAESRDQGKPVALATEVDIPRAVHNFRFFSTYILHMDEKSTELDGVSLNYVQRYPVGVAALISPWNLPLYLATWKLAPAIASGCTCVLKPSEFTSVTCWMLCDILNKAGLPPGVVNMVFGTGVNAGAPLVSHPGVSLVSFTGGKYGLQIVFASNTFPLFPFPGTATGEQIFKNCAPTFKKMSLELGGKNACIVFADADFEKTVAVTLRIKSSRIFVERPVYLKYLEAFKAGANALVVGHPSDPKTDMGPLVSEAHLQKVMGYVALAQQENGVIECGGTLVTNVANGEKGYYMRPTVLTGLSPKSRCAQEEIFGPVVVVIPFDKEEEVIEYANGTKYGLSASIWTRDLSRAIRVSGAMDVGTVWINQWMVRDLNLPFGGSKASGIGREGAPYSFDFFCNERAVMVAL